jgi:hypothetical protein
MERRSKLPEVEIQLLNLVALAGHPNDEDRIEFPSLRLYRTVEEDRRSNAYDVTIA